MDSRERVFEALSHREPDRVPVDFGGHLISGIHIDAYRALLDYLGMPSGDVRVERYRQRTAVIDEAVFRLFNADFRPLVPPVPDLRWFEEGDEIGYVDEWGVTWRRNGRDGLYFEHRKARFDDMPGEEELREMEFPRFDDPRRIAGLREKADAAAAAGKVPILDLPLGLEVFDAGFNICGATNFYMLLAMDPAAACYLMDRQLERQIEWWRLAFENIDSLSLVRIGDDLGSQDSMLISPEMYRELVLPRHRRLFEAVKRHSGGRAKIIMHSDGAIRPIIPDLIDAGIDCLNPVQYTVSGLDPAELKREFGRDLVFWGGGIDTQSVLPTAGPGEVRDEVRRQIDLLAPGGGFVFSQVHIIQADVPPANIAAMMEAALEYGGY